VTTHRTERRVNESSWHSLMVLTHNGDGSK